MSADKDEIILPEFSDLPQSIASSWGYFSNPWGTWNLKKLYSFFTQSADKDNSPDLNDPRVDANLPVLFPKFGPAFPKHCPASGVRATWLGHASVLFNVDGANILCDPIFSNRCSVMQWIGPARFRPPPCEVNDLPKLDAVVISHNHFDHMDMNTIADVGRHSPQAVWCVPMGCRDLIMQSLPRVPRPHVWEARWWDSLWVKTVKIVFTPTQHWSGRSNVFSFFSTLWGSWAIIGKTHRAWFAGDTGYCPIFKYIGERLGPFDVAAIPIGAYKPREALRFQHIDPFEAVQIHKDIKALCSIAIHWGTFPMGHEAYMDPKFDLQLAVERETETDLSNAAPIDFRTIYHGESLCFLREPKNIVETQSENDLAAAE